VLSFFFFAMTSLQYDNIGIPFHLILGLISRPFRWHIGTLVVEEGETVSLFQIHRPLLPEVYPDISPMDLVVSLTALSFLVMQMGQSFDRHFLPKFFLVKAPGVFGLLVADGDLPSF
jgi:hypothetical protein